MDRNTQAEPFPLEIEALQCGDVIAVDRLEMITRAKHGTDRYQFALRRLTKQIEKERARMGRPIVIKQRKGALHVCVASEQLQYAKRRSSEAARKVRRTMIVLVTTDVGELSDDELRQHERLALTTAARMLAFKKRSPKRISAAPVDPLSESKSKLLARNA